LTPVAVIFCAAFALLVSASSSSAPCAGREMIGTITYKNHFAERKASSQVMWTALAQSSPVYNGDTIHTTAGASAILHLDKQADVSLGEETFIRLDIAPKKAEILLNAGIISVRKSTSRAELGIATAVGRISIEEGELSAQGSGDKLTLSVAEGRASLDTGKGSQELETGASIALDSGRTARPIAQLLEPSSGSAVYRASEDSPTAFRWSPNPVALDRTARDWRLIVASDAAFGHIEASCDAKGSDASLSLSEGTHYWKIMASSAGGESAVGWFNLLRQESPRPIEPRDNRVFAYGEKPPLVSVSWSSVDNASGYRLTVVKADTGATILSRKVVGQSIALDSLPIGAYKWHVSAFAAGRAPGANAPDANEFAGPSSSFSIASQVLTAPSFRAPTMREPVGGSAAARLISIEALRRGASIAAWDEVPGADSYDARISNDREGRAPLAQARTVVNAVASPVPLAPGDYFLQVRSISGSDVSDYSPPIAFTVTEPQPIVALSPAEGFTADPESRRVRFVWDDPNDAGRVKLQLSSDPSFERPILELVSSDTAAEAGIPERASGRIYWRVAALSDELGRSSAVLSIRMPDSLAPPRITGPAEGQVIDISSTDTMRLVWEPSASANAYKASLYQLIGGRRTLIQTWDGAGLFASIPRLRDLGIGQFSWSVSALRTAGAETLSRSPEEIAYFALSHSHPLPPPVVHRPANGVKP
jgi:hypothetical protein